MPSGPPPGVDGGHEPAQDWVTCVDAASCLDATVEVTASPLVLRAMTVDDWPAVERIHAEGIATRNATFESEPPTWAEFDAGHTVDHRLVAQADGAVVGWAACSRTSSRCVYAGVLEISLYVATAARGHGVGIALMGALVEGTETAGVWTLQAGVFPENRASLALHRRFGFREVGRRERIGRLDGVWRDVILMERRSTAVG